MGCIIFLSYLDKSLILSRASDNIAVCYCGKIEEVCTQAKAKRIPNNSPVDLDYELFRFEMQMYWMHITYIVNRYLIVMQEFWKNGALSDIEKKKKFFLGVSF